MSIRKEKANQTRQKIVDAAFELMSHRPVAEVKVEDITEKAGVAKGTFYVYFKSKADVLHDIELDSIEHLLKYSLENNKSTETRILFYMRLYVKLMMDLSMELYKNVVKLELDAPKETLIRKNFEAIKQILLKDGYANDAKTDMAVHNMTSFLHGATLEWAIMEGKTNPDDVLVSHGKAIIHMLISNLSKQNTIQ